MVGLLKHQEVESWMLSELSSGKFRAGDRFYSETEVARRFGISPLTVRKAFASLVRNHFVTRRRHHGTFVNLLPDSPVDLRVFSFCLIGVLIGDVDLNGDLKIGRVLVELQKAIESTGYLPVIARDNPAALIEAGIRGVVSVATIDEKTRKLFAEHQIPLVEFNSAAAAESPHIELDYEAAADALAAAFSGAGRKRLAAVGSGTNAEATWRLFKPALTPAAQKYELSLCECIRNQDEFPDEFRKLLGASSPPDALFALNSWSLGAVAECLREEKLRVGRDISVIVHGSNALLIPHDPPYSIIDIDIAAAAASLIETMQRLIARPDADPEVRRVGYLPVVDRGSIGSRARRHRS